MEKRRSDHEPDASLAQGDVTLTVLVPVMNEVDSIRQLADELRAVLDDPTASLGLTDGWELVFIDDGSSDGSWERIDDLSLSDDRVKGVRLRRNFGKSAALAAGIVIARGEIIATMDGDLQDDPRELPGMIARLGSEADLVIGHKVERQDPLSKRLPSKLFNWVTGVITGLRLRDHNCGLKVGIRSAFTHGPLYGDMHRYFAAISHAQGFVVVEQPINHRPRMHGSSKFGLERYARGGLDLLTVLTLTRYHRRPLHLFGGLALALGLLGVAVLVYMTGVWLVTDDPIGNRPLLLLGALLVVVSLQLGSVGLLAELITHQNARAEDPFRHVTLVTSSEPRQGPGASRSPASPASHAPDRREEEIRTGVDDPQHDHDRRGLDRPQQG